MGSVRPFFLRAKTIRGRRPTGKGGMWAMAIRRDPATFEVGKLYPEIKWKTCTKEGLATLDRPFSKDEVVDKLNRLEAFTHFGLENSLRKIRAYCSKVQVGSEVSSLKVKLAENEKKLTIAQQMVIAATLTRDKFIAHNELLNKAYSDKKAEEKPLEDEKAKLVEENDRLKKKVFELEETALKKESEVTKIRDDFSIAHHHALQAKKENSCLRRSLDALQGQFRNYHERVIVRFTKSKEFQPLASKFYGPAYFQGYKDCIDLVKKKLGTDIGSWKANAADIPPPEDNGEEEEPLLEASDMPSTIRERAPKTEDEQDVGQGENGA